MSASIHVPPSMNAPDPTWREGIEAVQAESGGMMSLEIIRPADFPELFSAAIGGDVHAQRLSGAVIDTLGKVRNAPRKSPMLCGSCPSHLHRTAFSVVLATPARDDPTRCIALAICMQCGVTQADIAAKAVQALQRLWPDSKSVTLTSDHEAGHA